MSGTGPEFFQTRMGQAFYDGTLPRLVKAIERLTDRLDTTDLLAALQVITLTPHIAAYLATHDPKALEQARRAIERHTTTTTTATTNGADR